MQLNDFGASKNGFFGQQNHFVRVFLFSKKYTHGVKTGNFFFSLKTHTITIHLESSFLYATHADH